MLFGMETKLNAGLAVCFALFVLGLLSTGADFFSALAAALLFAPLLMAFFAGPAVIIALLFGLFGRRRPAEPPPWEDRTD